MHSFMLCWGFFSSQRLDENYLTISKLLTSSFSFLLLTFPVGLWKCFSFLTIIPAKLFPFFQIFFKLIYEISILSLGRKSGGTRMSIECPLGLTTCISQFCCCLLQRENLTISCCYGTTQTRDLMGSPLFLWYLEAVQHLALIPLHMGKSMGKIFTKNPSWVVCGALQS